MKPNFHKKLTWVLRILCYRGQLYFPDISHVKVELSMCFIRKHVAKLLSILWNKLIIYKLYIIYVPTLNRFKGRYAFGTNNNPKFRNTWKSVKWCDPIQEYQLFGHSPFAVYIRIEILLDVLQPINYLIIFEVVINFLWGQ